MTIIFDPTSVTAEFEVWIRRNYGETVGVNRSAIHGTDEDDCMLTKSRNSSGVSFKNAVLPDADLCQGMLSSASPTWLLLCSCTSPLCPEWHKKQTNTQKNNFKCRKLLIMILPSLNHNTTEFPLIAAQASYHQKTIWKLTITALPLRLSATRQGNFLEKKKNETSGGLGTPPPPKKRNYWGSWDPPPPPPQSKYMQSEAILGSFFGWK